MWGRKKSKHSTAKERVRARGWGLKKGTGKYVILSVEQDRNKAEDEPDDGSRNHLGCRVGWTGHHP